MYEDTHNGKKPENISKSKEHKNHEREELRNKFLSSLDPTESKDQWLTNWKYCLFVLPLPLFMKMKKK